MDNSSSKRLAKNTLFLYLRMGISMIVSLFTSRVVIDALGFADYGLYGVIGGIVSIFSFLNGAMSGASSRYIAIELGRKDYNKLATVFSTLFFSHVFIAIIIFILVETIGVWMLYNKLVIPDGQMTIAFWVLQLSLLTSLVSIVSVPYTAMIIAHENMKIYAYVSLTNVFIKLGIVYLLVVIPGPKLMTWAILQAVVSIGITIFYRIYVRIHYEGSKLRIVKEFGLYREIFGYVGSDLIGNISVLAQGQGLNLLLNMFFGPTVNAARNIAYTVQGLSTQFSDGFLTAIRPQIIKLHGEGLDNEMFSLMKWGSKIGYYLMWLVTLPVMLNGAYLVHLWLGKYPEYTIPFLNIILLISLVQVLKTPRVMIFHALGKLKLSNIVVGTILIMTFPISWVALKLGYGPTSVFWISFIDILSSEFASIIVLKHYISFNGLEYLKKIHLRCFLISVLSALIPYLYSQWHPTTTFIGLILNCIICVLCTVPTIWFIGLNKDEKNKAISLILSKFRHKEAV